MTCHYFSTNVCECIGFADLGGVNLNEKAADGCLDGKSDEGWMNGDLVFGLYSAAELSCGSGGCR